MINSRQINKPQYVLIVDDQEINRDVLGMIMADNYEVIYAENGLEALEKIRQYQEKLSAILLDLMMPVDVLKIDRKFISEIETSEKDFKLVELILDIAGYLKIPVIAEGVETQKQLEMLHGAGCDLVQGFYFARALPPEEFEKLIVRP
ncbi:MAG: EAL domain-containing response regulator [Flexilinea sp.]|nr:EAL domain-containing response regulator [Flexilinea sp.]